MMLSYIAIYSHVACGRRELAAKPIHVIRQHDLTTKSGGGS